MKERRRLTLILGSLVAVAVLMVWPLGASAVTILVYDDTLKDIQQTLNRPCVIGSPSCGAGAELIPFETAPSGSAGEADETSPTYTVGQLETAVGSSAMNLLIDVNQTGGGPDDPIQLDLVEVFVGGVLQFVFNGPQDVPLIGSLQGNGYSDAGLTGLDFSAFADTDTVVFHIVWQQDDGAESFFLAPTDAPPSVPEPSSLLLLGSGLVGVAVWARKRTRA